MYNYLHFRFQKSYSAFGFNSPQIGAAIGAAVTLGTGMLGIGLAGSAGSIARQQITKGKVNYGQVAYEGIATALTFGTFTMISQYISGAYSNTLQPSGNNYQTISKGTYNEAYGVSAQQNIETQAPTADFYVTPDGTAIPSTGYRYMDTKYSDIAYSTNSAPGSYFTFDKFETASEARNGLQISTNWSDAGLRGEFNTLQIIDDIRIPYNNNDTGRILEPLTNSFPKYGDGGYTQAKTGYVIKFIVDGLKNLGD